MARPVNLVPAEAIGTSGQAGPDAQGVLRGMIPPKLYRIGEVVSFAGVSRQTIHNYTTMGLLHESCWSPGGHRLYDESVFGRLQVIAEMKAANKSLRDIQDYFARLDDAEGTDPAKVGQIDVST